MDFYRTHPQIAGTLSPLSKELTLPVERSIKTLSCSPLELFAAIGDVQACRRRDRVRPADVTTRCARMDQ